MPVVAAAVIGAGASIYGASQQRKAANKAQKAQDAAAEKQLQLQREQFDRVVGLNQPFINGGYAAFDQLLGRLGVSGAGQPQVRPAQPAQRMTYDRSGNIVPVSPPAAQPAQTSQTGGTATPQNYQTRGFGGQQAPAGYYFGPSDELLPIPGGQAGAQPASSAPAQAGPDWQAYLRDNPDVAAAATAEGRDPTEYAQSHYQAFGQQEGRALPTMAPAEEAPPPQALEQVGTDYMNMARPEAPEAPTFQRPQDMQFRDYGDGPQFAAPTWQDIEKDPGFQWELKQGLGAVNAASAARGKLRSGDAARALQREGYGIAHSKGSDYFNRALQGYNANRSAFQDNRNFGTGLTQWQQGRADNVFGDDRAYDTARWQDARTYGDARFDAERNYQTNRFDNQTNNLFRVTGIGTGAAGNVSGAGASYANNAGNIFGNQADAASAAAQQRAAANAQAAGAIGGAVSNVFANWGGGARSTTPTTLGQAWNTSTGGGWQTPYNPTFVNTPSSIRPVF